MLTSLDVCCGSIDKRWKIFLYATALFCLVSLTLIQSGQIIHKYLQTPTYITSKYNSQGASVIPSISVCPALRSDGLPNLKQDVLDQYGLSGGLQSNDWRKAYSHSLSPDEIFNLAAYDTWDMVSAVDVNIIDDLGNNNLLHLTQATVKNGGYLQSILESRVHPKYGRCIVYLPKKSGITKGLNSIQIHQENSVKLSLRIFIHAEDNFWGATNREMGFRMDPFDVASTQVYYSDVKTIQDFSFIGNIPTCSYESYDKCIEESVYDRLNKEAGCRVPWIRNNLTVCSNPGSFAKAKAIVKDSIDSTNDLCLRPCDFLMASLGTANYEIGTNRTEMTFFMPSRVMKSTENYLISFMSMASEIGGYVGLLLGVSFYHFAQFIAQVLENRNDMKSVKSTSVKPISPPRLTKIAPVYVP